MAVNKFSDLLNTEFVAQMNGLRVDMDKVRSRRPRRRGRWARHQAGGEQVSASKRSIRRFVITEKAPTRAFSWLKAATTAFIRNGRFG